MPWLVLIFSIFFWAGCTKNNTEKLARESRDRTEQLLQKPKVAVSHQFCESAFEQAISKDLCERIRRQAQKTLDYAGRQ